MSFDLTNKNIEDTFQNLLQRTGSDNHLYDLVGNKVGDLRISGSLIANQYIVSSSVTNVIFQQQSGSTIFGDSTNDTHQFTGSLLTLNSASIGTPFDSGKRLTVEGDISASGHLYLNQNSTQAIYFHGTNEDDTKLLNLGGNIFFDAENSFYLRPSEDIYIAQDTTVWATFDGDDRKFSVIGNISASGTIIGSSLTITDDLSLRHITASGDISSSGNISANQLQNITRLTFDDGVYLDSQNGNVDFSNGIRTQNAGHITASGNISGSSTSTGSFGHILVDGNISGSSTSTGSFGKLKVENISANDGGTFLDDVRIHNGTTTGPKLYLSTDDKSYLYEYNGSLRIGADTDIELHPDVDFRIKPNGIELAHFDDSEKLFSMYGSIYMSGSGDTNLNVEGNITASSNLRVTGDISSSGTITADSASLSGRIDVVGRSKFGTTGASQASHHFKGVSGDSNFFLIFDKDGEEVMKGSGAAADSNLTYIFGDNAEAGNGTFLTVDDGNQKITTTRPLAVNTETPATNMELTVAGDISASGTMYASDISASGTIIANELQDTSLTNTRLIFAGVNGVLSDDADFTVTGNDMTLGRDLTVGRNLLINDGHITNVSTTHITASGVISASTSINTNTYNLNGKIVMHEQAADEATIGHGFNKINLGRTNSTPTIFTNALSITASSEISTSGDLISKDLYIDNNIFHNGDTDTKITFTDNSVRVTAGDEVNTTFNSYSTTLTLPVTASGDISSSGEFVGAGLNIKGTTRIEDDHIIITDSATPTSTPAGVTIVSDLDVRNHITASGGISSSGAINGNTLSVKNVEAITGDGVHGLLFPSSTTNQITIGKSLSHVTQGTTIHGNITASGDISSSGTITANSVDINGGTIDGITSLTAGTNLDIGGHTFRAQSLQADALSAGVVFTEINGLLTSDSDLTFSGDTLSATRIASTHITASGEISSSGAIYTTPGLVIGSPTVGSYISASAEGNLEISGSGTGLIEVEGNISASGTIYGGLVGSQVVIENGHITASGNISASGTSHTFGGDVTIGDDLVVSDLVTAGTGIVPDNDGGAYLGSSTKRWSALHADKVILEGDISQSGNFVTTGHITASGNISASGEFIGKVGTFSYGTGVESSVGDFSGEVIYDGDDSTTAGQIYYSNNGTWTHTDADAAATSTGLIAVALGSNSTTNGMLLRGTVKLDHDPGGNIGVPLYLSTTAGDATSTAPSGDEDIVRIIGYNLGTSGEIYFNPDNTWVEVNA
mgnify:CR=1 FL=1